MVTLKYPGRFKCARCGTCDYWVWDADDYFWTCEMDGNELYPPSMNEGTWGQAGYACVPCGVVAGCEHSLDNPAAEATDT